MSRIGLKETRPLNLDTSLAQYLRGEIRWEASLRLQLKEPLARHHGIRVLSGTIQDS
jgi:hypothetical protein